MAIYDMGYTDAMKRMNEIKAMIAEHSTQTVSQWKGKTFFLCSILKYSYK